MPWELGYFDGFNGAVAILPVTEKGENFQGQEYLGIYPYIDEGRAHGSLTNEMWINKNTTTSTRWGSWVSDPRAFRKTG